MSEVVLQTRTEHSRSIENGDRFRALEFLKNVGLLRGADVTVTPLHLMIALVCIQALMVGNLNP